MKTRTLRPRSTQAFTACLIAIGLIVGLMWALPRSASAQRPTSGPPLPARLARTPPITVEGAPAIKPLGRSKPLVSNTRVQAVALGQPGLSFRYVQTFGFAEAGYIEDTNHFYEVAGLGTDGTNVWIADAWGNRVLKFDGSGSFLQQIGKASFREATDTSLDYISDVAVDSGGNIWVADGGASHVVKFDASGNRVSELGQAWNSGSANDQFNDPISIAFDSAGNIYVSDSGLWGEYGNHRIQVFDSAGNYLTTIGETGVAGSDNAHFRSPRHIAIYDNKLYVADAGNHRVQILDVSTPITPTYVATLGTSGVASSDNSHFDYPEGVAVDAGFIYVADSNNNRLQIFNRTTYAYVATIGGGFGTGNYEFNHPTDVVVDSSGRIYVADDWNDRVQQYDSSRVYLRTYGTSGVPYVTDGYHYNYPTGVAVAADGSIYVVEERGHRLVKLNAAGAPQWTVGEPGQVGTDNDHFFFPNGVAVDSAGRVYVADLVNNRVQIFNSNGTYFATLGTGWGPGDYEFDSPNGVAVGGNGNIYVADRGNQRVQIYDNTFTYVGTLGETGVSGTDNAHFDAPVDVAVDSAGDTYVVDLNNHRVQVFNNSRAYVRTIGVSGECGDDFGHLCDPIGVTVDADGRTYVADGWGDRVQVFDNSGAYLTTIGGSWGNRSGQMRQADGLAVDDAGNLYIAEYLNHRIQKFAPGVPGWKQVNTNGFGERANRISTLAPFGGYLYAGTYNFGGNGAQLWRSATGVDWTPVITNGFGITRNVGIDHLAEFNGQLYAGTWADEVNGGEVWRSSDGLSWTRVISQGFGDPTNGEVFRFAVFSDTLYASTWSYTNTHGVEIWRSSTGNSGDWTQVVGNGFDGDVNNTTALSFETFNGYLYASTYNWNGTTNTSTGGEVWRSPTGDSGTWVQVNADGFGDASNYAVMALTAFNGYLYAGVGNWDPNTRTSAGGQLWRCAAASGCDENSDWSQVVSNGFGNPNNGEIISLILFDNALYAVTSNFTSGLEVWRSSTGDAGDWEQVGFAGFGDSNNGWTYWHNAVNVFNNRLFIGAANRANGGEVWRRNIPGDLNGDDQMTIQDLSWVAGAWRRPGDYYFDLDGDGKLTIVDIMREVVLWGGG